MNSDVMLGAIVVMLAVNFVGMIIVGIRVEIRGRRTDGYERRVAMLEMQARAAPTHNDLSAIRDRLAGMAGQMEGLSSRQTMATEMIRSIQQHLLGDDR